MRDWQGWQTEVADAFNKGDDKYRVEVLGQQPLLYRPDGPMLSAQPEEAPVAATATRTRGRPRKARPTRHRISPAKLTDAELLVRAMHVVRRRTPATTDAQFAEHVLLCHPRTLRKHLDGRRLPPLAREKLLQLVKPTRRR